MRLLLLMITIIMSSYSFAQNPQLKVQKTPQLHVKGLTKSQLDSLLKFNNVRIQNGVVQVSPKPKPGITYLADGMPCIVPDEPTAGKIPNPLKGIQLMYTNRIPNPALPKQKKDKM